MNLPVSSRELIIAAIAVLIGWRIYRRIRRLIGLQRVRPGRLIMTAVFFPLLLVFVALPGLGNVALVEGIVGGAVVGLVLGLVGLKLTRFETNADGFFYRPNTVLGVAISLLFIGRLIYRFGIIYSTTGKFDPETMQSFGRSPLTLALFGVVALYYATFALGVLAWYRKARLDAPATAASVDASRA